jgi:hypothetical protein
MKPPPGLPGEERYKDIVDILKYKVKNKYLFVEV